MAFLNNADEPEMDIRSEDWLETYKKNRDEAKRLLADLPNHWPKTQGSW